MAILYVTEFRDWGQLSAGDIPRAPFITVQQVSITSSSKTSSAYNNATHVVRLHADTTCAVQFGTSGSVPTATTTGSMRLSANNIGEYFEVNPGDSLAVIATT